MNDTLSYLMGSYYSITSFAVFVWILKQLFIAIRYAVKYFVVEERKDRDMETKETA